jgi:hypothetical protein
MNDGPLERVYGQYRIIFRKSEHLQGRPSPHVELWKGSRKIGNYDMATGRPLYGNYPVHTSVKEFLEKYLKDPQVQKKLMEAIESSFFDLSKVAGEYGGIPKGFKAEVKVQIIETDKST